MYPARRLEFDSVVVRRLFWWSFGIRFGAGFLGWILTVGLGLPFLQDAFYYERIGSGIAEDWMAGRSSWWLESAMAGNHLPWIMPFVIAVFYFVMGGVRAVPLLMAAVCLFSAITPVLVFKTAREAGLTQAGALFSARLVAFSPAFAFWSGALYKEGLILLFLSLGMYHVTRLQQRWSWVSLAAVVGSVGGLLGLRFYMALMMGAVLFVGLVFGRTVSGTDPVKTFLRQFIILAVVAVVVVQLGLGDRLERILPTSLGETLRTIDNSRRDLAQTGASGFAADVDLRTPEGVLSFLPVGVSYFLFAPMPWQFGEMRQNLAIPETVVWSVIFYPLIVAGVARGIRRNPQVSVLLFAAIATITLLYSVFAGNIGTIFRMRIQMWLFASIFAGWGWERLKEVKTEPVRSRSIVRSAIPVGAGQQR